ncbi:MAG: hypothetical protein ACXVDE_01615 [Tumebacillaceae bacterium]|jgi:hypothetical protein
MYMDRRDDVPQHDSVEHIMGILNDVKSEALPVSDALDSLAYWYHEAFQSGDIAIEQGDADADVLQGEDIWT